jgi:hypothetical protein
VIDSTEVGAMVRNRHDSRASRDRNRTRHDYVLAGIGVALTLSVAIGLATSIPLRSAVGAATPVAAGLVADALFVNPPRPRSDAGDDRSREPAGAD